MANSKKNTKKISHTKNNAKKITKAKSAPKAEAKKATKTAQPVNNVQKTKPKVKVEVKKFSIFRLLKSRYFVFGFLTIAIVLAAFALFLIDKDNIKRPKELNNVKLIMDILNLLGIGGDKRFNVSITTWLVFFVGFGLFYISFIVWAFFNPIREKVVYQIGRKKKYTEYVINKRKTVYNIIFFGLIGIIVVGYAFFVFNLFPWKDMKFTDIGMAEIKNFGISFGILMGLLLIPVAALLLIMLVFKLLVLIFVFFASSVSKGVMKTEGYQEALATSQLVNKRLQQETLKELGNDIPVNVTKEQRENMAGEINAAASKNGAPVPGYTPVPQPVVYQQQPLPVQKIQISEQIAKAPKIMFPALYAIDNKYKGKTIPSEKPIKLKSVGDTMTVTKNGVKTQIKVTPQNDPNNLIKDFAPRFQAYLAKNYLYFGLDVLRAFIAGLNASRLILLEGLSGTGKSTLPRVFNEFVGGKSSFFPVQATWRDRTDIVGYYSDFTKQFKETEFLKSLYESSYTTKNFNIMVLDEMNISRVEYYFADFLSVLEYPQEEWLVPLINSEDDKKLPKNLINGKVRIPSNTWFIGTINVDDSTFTVSDKVYDRVVVIDFKELSMPFTTKVDDSPWHMTPQELLGVFEYVTNSDIYHLSTAERNKFIKLCDYTSEIFDIKFGNRMLNQIYYFVPVYVALGGSKEEALDFMFARKILRKVDGKYENYISVGLTKLTKYLQTAYGKGHYKETNAYIEKMRKKLL